jgi:hypothetical protein
MSGGNGTRKLTAAELEQRRTAPAKHGASSEVQIVRRATVEKRRLLRQIGLRQGDLNSIGRALLTNWARSAAALQLMDAFAQEHGWLKPDGEPRGFARLYVSMLNAERLALTKLEEHIRARGGEPSMVMLMQQGARELERR